MGTMSFGTWSSKQESFAIMDTAFDRGINFFDTAEVYPVPPTAELVGLTEKIFGEWIKTKDRDALIIATKVAGAASGWFVPPIRQGLTAIDRHHVERAVEGSLQRLGVDYIDLYQVHWPDTVLPIVESMEALDRLVQAGKVRYVGTSNENAYGLTKANTVCEYEGLAKFQSIQNNFSLINPRFLDELANVCRKEQVSLLPYSPIGGGVLSGKYNGDEVPRNTRFGDYLHDDNPRQKAMADRFVNDATIAATAKYLDIARQAEMSPVTLATAWSMNFDFVASTIIGARTAEQLEAPLAALDIKLSDEVMQQCAAVQKEILYPMG
jgi:aryl-alcohol dehydrogenase-like predicted oxidoreductase|tara:strand:- start:683 stop:1651 length:969 start_codon:yes stop_codon:yes gene_type:complete